MKYTKPNEAIEGLRFHCRNDSPTSQGLALLKWIDSLPDRPFEIVEPGMTQVKWPEGLTRERLKQLASPLLGISASGAAYAMAGALESIAAIAPEEKKKRKVWLWEKDHPHYTERSWTSNDIDRSGGGWRKVGECEVTE